MYTDIRCECRAVSTCDASSRLMSTIATTIVVLPWVFSSMTGSSVSVPICTDLYSTYLVETRVIFLVHTAALL